MSLKKTHEQLVAERDRLVARLEAIKSDYARGLDPDSAERAVQLENAETLNEIQRVTTEQIAQIEEQIQECEQ